MALDLGELSARLSVDDTHFDKGLTRAQGRFGVFGANIKKAAAVAGVAAVAAIGVIAVKGVKQFAAMESGMNEVFTLLPGISKKSMDQMSGQVKDFSVKFGVLPDKVVPALYQALSAGVPKGNVFDFMETAQKAAKGGVTTLETAVNGLTGVVNAYGSDVISTDKASDLMFTTVRLGKTNFEELSASLGDVTPIASALGVSFDQVSAAMAASTAITGNTAKSTTGLKGLLSELGKEGQVAAKNFEKIAGKSFPAFIKSGGTLQEALQLMEKDAQKSGGSIMDMFGSVEAGSVALQLTGKGTKTFTKDLEAMQGSAGATDAAYDQMNQGLAVSWEKIKASASVAMVNVGKSLAPVVQKFSDFAVVAMPKVVVAAGLLAVGLDMVAGGLGDMFGFMQSHETTFKITAGIITAIFLPALISMGVKATIAGVKTAAAWIMSSAGASGAAALSVGASLLVGGKWLWAGVQATAGALKMAAAWLIGLGPIGLVIAVVTGAVILIIKYWDKIGPAFSKSWKWIQRNVFNPIGGFFTTTIPGWVSSGVGKIKTGWHRLQEIVAAPYRWVKKNVFSPLGHFIKDTIPDAFSKGVSSIGRSWNRLKSAARKPVEFVVNSVINPLVRGINKILPKKWELDTIKGFSAGGYTGNFPIDKMVGGVHGDEHVIQSKSRRKFEADNPGALDFINMHGALPGYASGGRVVPGRGNRHSGYGWATYAGDFPNPVGTPVHAWKNGVVAMVRTLAGSYGKHMRFNNTDGTSWLVAHLSRFAAAVGDRVRQGQTVGYTGNTGNSTGPHAHLEFMGGSYKGGPGGDGGDGISLLGKIRKYFTAKMPGFISKAANNGGMFGGGFGSIIKNMGTGALQRLKGLPAAVLNAAWAGVKNVGSGIKNLAGFDSGGLARGAGYLPKPTVRPERVLSPQQTAAFEKALGRGFRDSDETKDAGYGQLLDETRRQNDLLVRQNKLIAGWPAELQRRDRQGVR